jgi:hypothetical protein
MNLTIDRRLDGHAVAAMYNLYQGAFGPLTTLAAARHVLTAEEFSAEMADERLEKYVAWSDDGQPVGITTLATDLAAIAWISPEYYAAAYPEHFARGAVFYLGITCVSKQRQHQGGYPLMIHAVVNRLIEANAVCGYDTCAYNDAHGMTRSIVALCRSGRPVLERRDTQTYYTLTFGDSR